MFVMPAGACHARHCAGFFHTRPPALPLSCPPPSGHLFLVTLNEVKGPVKSCITKKRPVRFARDACCWSVDVFLSDYKLDCFETKSPTFVGLFMDKKSMLRNGVENFRAC
jgi:hypothetical protein